MHQNAHICKLNFKNFLSLCPRSPYIPQIPILGKGCSIPSQTPTPRHYGASRIPRLAGGWSPSIVGPPAFPLFLFYKMITATEASRLPVLDSGMTFHLNYGGRTCLFWCSDRNWKRYSSTAVLSDFSFRNALYKYSFCMYVCALEVWVAWWSFRSPVRNPVTQCS